MLLLVLACSDGTDDTEKDPVEDSETVVVEDCEAVGDEDGNGLADCEDPLCESLDECVEDEPPSEPVIRIVPEAPLSDEVLVCEVLEPGVDPDGETVIHLFAWLQNGEDASETGDTISAFKTATGDQWTCQVNAWDGTLQSEPVQVTVLIGE